MAIKLKMAGVKNLVRDEEYAKIEAMAKVADELVYSKEGAGNDFLGWVNLPFDYDKEEFARIKAAGKKIQSDSEVLVVIGIGGSYLGGRAALDFINGMFYNSKKHPGLPDVYFVGNNISSEYLTDIVEMISDRSFSINVISKSGTTTEPAIAFRIFKKLLEDKYGKEEAVKRIYATTDKARGALKNFSDKEGYETFVIPDDVGGRFSVLTPVGLVLMAAAGIDIDAVMQGAADAAAKYKGIDNDCAKYAITRALLNKKGKVIEILANYEPCLTMFGEWYKQLFAESEGKDQKGTFPVSANFSTDLHSIGQFIQDGTRNMFETVLWVKNSKKDLEIIFDEENIDGLNFVAGKTMQYVNSKAYAGTYLAHIDGGVPTMVIEIEDTSAYSFGEIVYFFEKALSISGYLLAVNPFDQPGVESYKKNMFALLGKPGYEADKEALEARLIN
ncbi:MAG: glucose-6-phosphate isomerase [Clostridiales bacterium]|nr:glucose-6-phosphate isomerase [Clostridiales bacterium]